MRFTYLSDVRVLVEPAHTLGVRYFVFVKDDCVPTHTHTQREREREREREERERKEREFVIKRVLHIKDR